MKFFEGIRKFAQGIEVEILFWPVTEVPEVTREEKIAMDSPTRCGSCFNLGRVSESQGDAPKFRK